MADIVVIDDEIAIRDLLCGVLEDAGHAVTGYSNGRAGIEHLKRERVDLLVTDIFMPEMEGLETIRRARAIEPELPIIAISGGWSYGGDYLWVAQQFGALETLKKPFLTRDLLAKVDALLGHDAVGAAGVLPRLSSRPFAAPR